MNSQRFKSQSCLCRYLYTVFGELNFFDLQILTKQLGKFETRGWSFQQEAGYSSWKDTKAMQPAQWLKCVTVKSQTSGVMSYVSTTFLWPLLDLSVLPVSGALEQLVFLFMHFIFFSFFTILYSPAGRIWCVLSMFKGAKWGLKTHEENCHNTNNREHYKYNWVFRLLPGSAPNYRHNSS